MVRIKKYRFYKGNVGILICVIVAVMADKVLGTDNTLRLAIILCFCGNEGISILESLTKLGVPIPQKLLDALLQLKGNGGNKDANNDANNEEIN